MIYRGSIKKIPRPTFKKIYAALPEQLVANINNCPFWVNFDKHLIVTFLGIADDCLSSFFLNKCDEKTQRQLAETWSYGWILHGIISGRTRLRKHHKVLYNRGNELPKFGVVWETALSSMNFPSSEGSSICIHLLVFFINTARLSATIA